MQLTTGLLGSTVLIAFSVVAACGSSDTGGGGGGGKGGTGGTTSTGSGGKGGSSSGSSSGGKSGGSTGGSSSGSGGKASGGTGSNTGGFGVGGFGGAFDPNDYLCDPVPEAGAACQAGELPCVSGTDVCACNQGEWSCLDVSGVGGTGGTSGQIGNLDCPATKPADGVACGDAIGFCPYGDGANAGCACYQGEWACLP
ncbi:MAG TPA: hypothetical protein VIW29_17405 [Polyangiaceae bacterium]